MLSTEEAWSLIEVCDERAKTTNCELEKLRMWRLRARLRQLIKIQVDGRLGGAVKRI